MSRTLAVGFTSMLVVTCTAGAQFVNVQMALLAPAPAALIPAGEQYFYSVDRANDELVIIDTATGTVHALGPVGEDLEDVDLTMRDGELLGLARESGANQNNRLLTFSPATGAIVDSLFIDHGSSIEGLAADVAGELLIGYDPIQIGNDFLAELGDTGGITTITGLLEYDIDGLGIAPDGRVYAVDAFGGSNVSEIVLPGGVVSVANLAIGAQDVEATATSLWALAPDGQLVQLDRFSGATSAAIQLDSPGRELYGIALVDTATITVIDGDVTQRDLNGITVIEGAMVIIEMPDVPCLSFENLTQVTGSISAYQIAESFCLDMPGATVGGDVYVDQTGGGVDVSIGGDAGDTYVDQTGGGVDVTIGGNAGDTYVDQTGGGVDVSIGGDAGDIYVDQTGGGVTIGTGGNVVDGDIVVTSSDIANAASTGPQGAVSLTLGGATVTGSITITAGKPTTMTPLVPLSVGGDLTADHLVQSPLDLSMIAVAGATSIRADASNPITAQVAALDTRIVADHGSDLADIFLNTGAVTTGELITLERLGGSELQPELGFSATGQLAKLDPMALYTIDLGAPLGGLALLNLVLDLDALAPDELSALGAAIDAGRATLATADSGEMLTALPLCGTVAPGCAELALLDADGLPTSFEQAVTAEFRAQPTSFSDWAIVLELCFGDVDGNGLVDVNDLVAIIIAWGTDDPAADLDGSGSVDVGDLVAVIVDWACV